MTSQYQLFIADLHLDPAKRPTLDLAMRFLEQAREAQHLYILGDLFEYWLGDDVGVPLYANFIQGLRQLGDAGCAITVMHGNRDFLLGDDFAKAAGVTLIKDDELLITLNERPVLLMHGDTLCTEDTDYQAFRQQVRHPQWQQQFLDKPAEERRHHAEALRSASHEAGQEKQASIMDVNTRVAASRLEHHRSQILIHGHTHRPASHTLTEPDATRFVVGDWHAQHARFLLWNGQSFELRKFTRSTTLCTQPPSP